MPIIWSFFWAKIKLLDIFHIYIPIIFFLIQSCSAYFGEISKFLTLLQQNMSEFGNINPKMIQKMLFVSSNIIIDTKTIKKMDLASKFVKRIENLRERMLALF